MPLALIPFWYVMCPLSMIRLTATQQVMKTDHMWFGLGDGGVLARLGADVIRDLSPLNAVVAALPIIFAWQMWKAVRESRAT